MIPGVEFVSRSEWGARPPKRITTDPGVDNDAIVVHHTGAHEHYDRDPVRVMRSVQSYHMDTRGWNDIAYNWCIDPKGVVYEGRGLGHQSGATKNWNQRSWSICLLGNYSINELTFSQVWSFGALRGWLVGRFPDITEIVTHQHAARECACGATECPGANVISRMSSLVGDDKVTQVDLSSTRDNTVWNEAITAAANAILDLKR